MPFSEKEGSSLKRFLMMALTLAILLSLLVLPASAASTVSRMESYVNVHANGDCQITLTVTMRMETAVDSMTFPLPPEAENISVNGNNARTTQTASAVLVDISRQVSGLAGEFSVRFDYTVPDVVKVVENKITMAKELQLQLPLLSGFSLPVDYLSFVVTLPAPAIEAPRFTSTYRQSSIDSALDFVVNSNMITGSSNVQLNDHEAVMMTMTAPQEMFPGVKISTREGDPELIPMLSLLGVALLYWLIFLRTGPLGRSRNISPPQGISPGEMGCHLTLSGGDLTMMVLGWAQLGYIMIQLDEHGRVLLHKRMDMGNERSPFENRVFKLLFGQKRIIDATGGLYAKLCLKVQRMVPGEKSMVRASSGNMKLFRWICCGSHVFCGICVAMNFTAISVLQVLLAVALGILAAVTAWLIQEMAYRTHLRGKVPVYIGLACVAIWIILGLLCGQLWIPLGSALAQYFLGYFAAYGGKRSDIGRMDAGLILGLRGYMKKITPEELQRLMRYDPDYFFHLAPYALALGVVKPFARNFGERKLEQCPYIVTRIYGQRTAREWAQLLAEVADAMDERHRRMMVDRWIPIRFR